VNRNAYTASLILELTRKGMWPFKMADDKSQLEGTLNTLLQIMEKSGNLRKDLKQEMVESVSTLKIFLLI
jgi:hypothetical protein